MNNNLDENSSSNYDVSENSSQNTNYSNSNNPFSCDFISSNCIFNRFSLNSIKKYFSEFHKFDYNMYKLEFVETECGHLFHTVCLEKWIIQRRECPSCRSTSMME